MPQVIFRNVPSGITLSESNVSALANSAREVAQAFASRLAAFQKVFAEARDNYSREADSIVSDANPGERATADRFAKQRKASKIAEYKRSLLDNTRKERREMLDRLARYAAEAEAIRSVNTSPAMTLGRVGLGEQRRTNLQHQLEGAGPMELIAAARQSILLGDVLLAAAVATVVDRRPRDRRPFSVGEFATRVIGVQWRAMEAKLAAVDLARREAESANDEFERGPDPMKSIAVALARRAVAELEAAVEDDSTRQDQLNAQEA